jgi:glycosyltransferase involved in cell wall biosynthesis
MKITQVISDSNVGGAGILVASICEALSGDFDMELILPLGSALTERIDAGRVKLTHLPFAKDRSFDMRDVLRFSSYFSSSKPDIVHTHACTSARLAAKLSTDAVLLSTRHCATGKSRHSTFKSALYRYFTDLTVSTADCVKAELISEGVDSEKIKVIRNGSKATEKPDTDTAIAVRRELSIPQRARIIGCIGRLERVKGQDLLIRCAARLLRTYPDLYFVFVGDGEERERYASLARDMGVEKRTIFTGYTAHPEIYRETFCINVCPSRGTETSSLAISESMSQGIVTVASDFGGNREMIRHGKDGLLFSSCDVSSLCGAISTLLDDPIRAEKMAEAARVRYEKDFSLERMAGDYRRLYLECAGARQRR